MTTDKNKVLTKIKQNVGRAVLPGLKTTHPGTFTSYTYAFDTPGEELVEPFKQEVEKLAGHVYVLTDVEEATPTILKILEQHEADKMMAWAGEDLGLPWLPPALADAGITIIADEAGHLSPEAAQRKETLRDIDAVRVGLTGAQGGLADSGAVALISGPGRGRLASLLPPVHIALLSARQIYPSLPAFLAAHPTATQTGSNLVFIAGPSRTGDIEMTLSMGVHGPGEVHVLITP